MFLNKHLLNPWAGIYFDDDDPPAGDDNNNDDPPDDNNADPGGNDGGGSNDNEPTFTQADVDRIVGERAKRAGKAAVSDLLESLGLEKPDDLKKLVEAQRKATEKEKSDLQKAQEKAQAEEQKRQELEARLQRERVDRVIEREAQALGFADVTDATSLVDRSLIEVEEDGVTGVKEALEALLKSKPHLKAQQQGDPDPAPDLDGDKGKGGKGGKSKKGGLTDQQRTEYARRYGIK